jgi:hypothetical protein
MFENLYEFQVQEEMLNGHQVMCLDKQECVLYDLVKISVDEYIQLLKAAKDEKTNRYLFYYWKEDPNDTV